MPIRRTMLLAALAGLLVGLVLGPSPSVAGAATKRANCAARSVEVGDRGKCAKRANWLLAGKRPSAFRSKYYRPVTVKQGIRYRPRSARASRELKYRLGFPCGKRRKGRCTKINGAFGPVLAAYVMRKIYLPVDYRTRSGNRKLAHERNQRRLRANRSVSGLQGRLIRNARELIAAASTVHYTQDSRRDDPVQYGWPILPGRHVYVDCSSSVEWIYKVSGAPSPSGTSWVGYTGTQTRHGRVVWNKGQSLSSLRPGDLIFYGYGWPYTHVVMYLGNGRVYSHGSEGGPYNLPVYYRYDVSHARRYF